MNDWEQQWGSIHEAAHAVVARYFGLEVSMATMDFVRVAHRPYAAPDCDNSIAHLIMSAAGDAATTALLNWTGTDHGDNELARERLRSLGAGFFERRRLMRAARKAALVRVWGLRREIFAVADVLRERRVMGQGQIDAAITNA